MKFRIIHTNDLHSHLEHWKLLAKYIKDQQILAQENNLELLTLDIGDAIDSFHPLVEATYGKIIIDLFNQANYDIVTLGNNEGLNLQKERVKQIYDRADFDIVLGNLIDNETGEIPEFVQEIVYRQIGTLKIAFIGLTVAYDSYEFVGYHTQNPIDKVQDLLEKIDSEKVNLIVLLSHLGIQTDRYIANLFPQIQLIIGAHTHHVLMEGEWVNQSLVCAAGKYGNYIGIIDLLFDEVDKDWNFEARVVTIDQLSQQYQLPKEEDSYRIKGQDILKMKPVANLPHSYYALELAGNQSFAGLALDAMTNVSKIDLGIISSGLFLRDLPQGIVTENDLHEALPHPIHLANIQLLGRDLLDLLDEMFFQADDLKYKLVSGNGFRGKVFGEIVFKGIEYHQESSSWYVQGSNIQLDEMYDIVTIDHLLFLPFFPTMAQNSQFELIFPDFIRHIVRNYLEKIYPLESDVK